MVNHFEKFTVNNISKRLNKINPESSSGQALKISLSHQRPFPKLHLLSKYQFKKRFIKVFPDGNVQGGYPRMITSLIDFSFIRSLVAHCYAVFGPPCYDPVSLFLLDLFRYIDGYQDMSRFLPVVLDQDQGRGYRTYAGISTDNIPCEATFSNFRSRIGENLYNEIFHVLVDIFHQLEMITFKILTHDGTLYPTLARYKGCTYFCQECQSITVNDVTRKVRNRILYRLNNLSKNNLGSECRVYTDCPSNRFPEDVKKPKIELFALRGVGSTSQRPSNSLSMMENQRKNKKILQYYSE
ncbi:MAG: hypothetical protein SCARUB_04878 [Candidatus Scalindua rubra]|uniref:Transposase n=1 Tax=Candidatus Scalindua rubra TaxID=1872076 RepID=A0A1E3X4W4_9BACT|nr:MAG: hypothetical protein SCARUB_04878 [Candidatus Scalindua rubra]